MPNGESCSATGPRVRQIRFGPEILPSCSSPTVRTRCGIAGRTDPNRASCSPHLRTAWPGLSRVWSCRLSRPCAHLSSFGKDRRTTCGFKEVSPVEGRFTTHSRPIALRGRSPELLCSPVQGGTGPSWRYRGLCTPNTSIVCTTLGPTDSLIELGSPLRPATRDSVGCRASPSSTWANRERGMARRSVAPRSSLARAVSRS